MLLSLFFLSLSFFSTSSKFVSDFPPDSQGNFINSGSPGDIPISFDCAVREYAYEYGQSMQPRHGTFVQLFDALQLQVCNKTRPKPMRRNIPKYPKHDPNDQSANLCVYYVDPKYGNDTNSGTTPDNAYLTIQKAIKETKKARNESTQLCTINLLEGIFYEGETILLTPEDSYLTIQNYNGAEVVLSGGISLEFEGNWKLEKYEATEWRKYDNYNNVYNRAFYSSDNDLVKYIGNYSSYSECQNAIETSTENPFYSFTWHNKNYGDFAFHCYGVRDISWQPVLMDGIYSGRLIGSNIWSIKVKNYNELNNNQINGLRINNNRAILARYPDQNPETQMQYDKLSGWIVYDTQYIPSEIPPNEQDIIINGKDYPNVIWPETSVVDTAGDEYTGLGDWGDFWQGKGGYCTGMDPDFGYWCSSDNPRTNDMQVHKHPGGIILDPTAGLNLPYYSGANDAILFVWNPAHWYNWMFNISDYNINNGKVMFDYGGDQGASGFDYGAEYIITNVYEELTMPNEYFYNQSTHTLYFYYNSTFSEPPPINTYFVATRNKMIFNISGNYKKQSGDSVKNITIRGVTIRDTLYTYLEPYGLPSGGDWALSKNGAIFFQGTENCTIDNIHMTLLDGNGIFIFAYNRNLTIKNSEFSWLGESAMASWGCTEGMEDLLPCGGPDGRPGNQPRYTTISNNLGHEIGIWEKQTSMWFQAQTAQTTFKNNIFFNGPRSGININDGFGQENHIYNNLLLNTCKESTDHGPYNSWDRIPYITNIGNGTSSIVPGWNHIYNNFMIGNYGALWTVDNDDGSSLLKIHNNFMVYAVFALKSDYAGHDVREYNNIYAYLDGPVFNLVDTAGAYDWFINNSVIIPDNSYYTSTCNLPNGTNGMIVYNNSIYMPYPNEFRVCGMTWNEWQSYGNDNATTIHEIPSNSQIINWAKQLLPY